MAVLTDRQSGRVLEVSTDMPGVQVYAGCWLAGSPINKAGRSYDDYDGVAIECRDFPDAPNVEAFPRQCCDPERNTNATSISNSNNNTGIIMYRGLEPRDTITLKY